MEVEPDLEDAAKVTGLEIIGRTPGGWHGRFGYIGHKDPWKHEFILQVVDTPKGHAANRVHIDLTPNEGMDRAVERISPWADRSRSRRRSIRGQDPTVTNHPSWTGRSCRTPSGTSSA